MLENQQKEIWKNMNESGFVDIRKEREIEAFRVCKLPIYIKWLKDQEERNKRNQRLIRLIEGK